MRDLHRVLDLFSGIGGFSLGLEQTGGFKTEAFCEIDPFAKKVLRKHWPNTQIFGDIRNLEGSPGWVSEVYYRGGGKGNTYDLSIARRVDVIVGGFPCQDLSTAGKGAGLDGPQSRLWFEFYRLICEIRPKWVVVENVSALRAKGLDRILKGLAEIGYDAEWYNIPAYAVGAPHKRERLWIIAYPQRNQQSREEPRCRSLGRVGRLFEPLPWDTPWQVALAEFRGMVDGVPKCVDRTDAIRNSLVPQIPYLIGKSILEYDSTLTTA